LLSEHEFEGTSFQHLESLVSDDTDCGVRLSEQEIKNWDEGE